MRAHMLSLLIYSSPSPHATQVDLPSHRQRADELLCRETLEPALVDHVNRHFQADPAFETTVIERLNLKAKGSLRAFEAIARFHGHRVQGDVAVMGTIDPATGSVLVKRLKERSVSRRGDARKATLLGAAKQLLRKTAHLLHP